MRKYFFDCELLPQGHCGPVLTAVLDVTADSPESARLALLDRCAHELPGLMLARSQLLFSRCESLTEFIRKAA